MDGFDQEWLTNHTRRTGARATVQAGAGSKVAAAQMPERATSGEVPSGPSPASATSDAAAPDPFELAKPAGAITLVLPYPISANRYWRTRVIAGKDKEAFVSTYVSTEAKAYKADVQRFALMAGIRKPLAGRIAIAYTLYPNRPQDWARRAKKDPNGWADTVQCIDLDNCNKVLLDALKGIAFDDDKWVRRIVCERAEPDGEARLVVTIAAIPLPKQLF